MPFQLAAWLSANLTSLGQRYERSLLLAFVLVAFLAIVPQRVVAQKIDSTPRSYQFQFHQASWAEVFAWLSEETHYVIRTLDLPEGPVNAVDLSGELRSPEDVLDTFAEMLIDEGFGVIVKNRHFTVLDLRKAENRPKVAWRVPEVSADALATISRARVVRTTIDMSRVASLSPRQGQRAKPNLTSQLRPLLSRAGDIIWKPGMRHATIIDAVTKIRAVQFYLEQQFPRIRRIRLSHRSAALVLDELAPLISNSNNRAGRSTALRLSIGDDGQSILVSGNEQEQQHVAELVEQLDTNLPAVRVVESFNLNGIETRNLIPDLRAMLAATLPGATQTQSNPRRNEGAGKAKRQQTSNPSSPALVLDQAANCLWFAGSQLTRDWVKKILDQRRKDSRPAVASQVRFLDRDDRRTRRAIELAASVWRSANSGIELTGLESHEHVTAQNDSELYLTAALPGPRPNLHQTDSVDQIHIGFQEGHVRFVSKNAVALTEFSEIVTAMLALVPERATHWIKLKHQRPSLLVPRIKLALAAPTTPKRLPDRPPQQSFTSASAQTSSSDEPIDAAEKSEATVELPREMSFASSMIKAPVVDQPPVELYPIDNAMEIRFVGTDTQFNEVSHLVQEMDVPTTRKTRRAVVVRVMHRSATECAQNVRLSLGGGLRILPIEDAPTDVMDKEFHTPTILVDDHTNQLILLGDLGQQPEIASLIRAFDQAESAGEVVTLVENVSSPIVLRALQNLVSGSDGSGEDPRDEAPSDDAQSGDTGQPYQDTLERRGDSRPLNLTGEEIISLLEQIRRAPSP